MDQDHPYQPPATLRSGSDVTGPPTPAACMALAIAAQTTAGLAAGIIQWATLALGWHWPTTIDGERPLPVILLGSVVQVGGYSVRWAFETLMEAVGNALGHRVSTLHLPLYFPLWLLQVLLVTFITAWWLRRPGSTWRKLTVVFVALLVNGLLNITWPWWGS